MLYIYPTGVLELPADIISCDGKKETFGGVRKEFKKIAKERIAEGDGVRERGNGGGGEAEGRHRQLSHISGLIGTDKVLLEDSVPTALFALESQGQIYYD